MATFEELMERLADKTASSYSRRSAISNLGRLGDERAVEPLAAALQDEDRYIRREAAKALGETGFPSAVEPLIRALGDSEEYVRQNAITALGIIGDERAIQPLKQALEDKSFFTRREAEKNLQTLEKRLKEATPIVEPTPEPEPPPSTAIEAETELENPPEPEDIIQVEPEAPLPATVAETTTVKEPLTNSKREEVQRQVFEHHAGRARQIAREVDERYDREARARSSRSWSYRWRGIPIPVIIIGVIVVLRVMREIPLFLIPGLLAVAIAVSMAVLKKRQSK